MKARLTQRLANTYPPWSLVRSDDQSVGQQFLNAAGINLDKLNKEISRGCAGWHLATTPIPEVAEFYQYRLPGNFTFSRASDDDTELEYETPVVSGYIGPVAFDVALAENNDIDGFWYQAVPDRWELLDITTNSFLVASGFVADSPIRPLLASGLISPVNRLGIKLDNAESYFGYENGILRRGLVQIEGENRELLDINEGHYFLQDEIQYTTQDFSSVSGIHISGIEDDTATTIQITSAEFQNGPYRSPYDLDYDVNGESIPTFWAVESGSVGGRTTLDLVVYETPDLALRAEGFSDTYVALSQEFVNSIGSSVNIVDIALEPWSDWLWAVDHTKLYLYKTDLPYPNCQTLDGKTAGPASILEISDEYVVPGTTITMNYIWKRPVRSPLRHRIWFSDPVGTKYAVENGVISPYTATLDFWIYNGEPHDRHLQTHDHFILNDPGVYTFALEVQYSDGTLEVDKKIVYVVQISPLAEYDLTTLGVTGAIVGVDIDSQHYLWVLDHNGVRYKLARHFDSMLIDYTSKIIYFREDYDTVRVIE